MGSCCGEAGDASWTRGVDGAKDSAEFEVEGKAISEADEDRVRELLDPSTKAGRVCLRMLDQGEPIGKACMAEGIDANTVMAEWHRLTDANGVLSIEGLRPCISVLNTAWRRKWAAADAGTWVAVDAGLAPAPLANPNRGVAGSFGGIGLRR